MLIDWFTVVAQIINFLILVYLLRRFLYGPIVNAMEEREAKIAMRLQDAAEKEAQAEEERARYEQRLDDLEERRNEMLEEAQQEVSQRREQMLEEARQEVDRLSQEWRSTVHEDKRSFLRALRQRSSHHLYQTARRTLADLADAELEAQMVRVFCGKLESLEDEEWDQIRDQLQRNGADVLVRSAFELPEHAREDIAACIFGGPQREDGDQDELAHLRFEQDPDLISGIELRAHERIVAWNLEDHLDALERQVADTLEAEALAADAASGDQDSTSSEVHSSAEAHERNGLKGSESNHDRQPA